jgi:hypothetical protein
VKGFTEGGCVVVVVATKVVVVFDVVVVLDVDEVVVEESLGESVPEAAMPDSVRRMPATIVKIEVRRSFKKLREMVRKFDVVKVTVHTICFEVPEKSVEGSSSTKCRKTSSNSSHPPAFGWSRPPSQSGQ